MGTGKNSIKLNIRGPVYTYMILVALNAKKISLYHEEHQIGHF